MAMLVTALFLLESVLSLPGKDGQVVPPLFNLWKNSQRHTPAHKCVSWGTPNPVGLTAEIIPHTRALRTQWPPSPASRCPGATCLSAWPRVTSRFILYVPGKSGVLATALCSSSFPLPLPRPDVQYPLRNTNAVSHPGVLGLGRGW